MAARRGKQQQGQQMGRKGRVRERESRRKRAADMVVAALCSLLLAGIWAQPKRRKGKREEAGEEKKKLKRVRERAEGQQVNLLFVTLLHTAVPCSVLRGNDRRD
jgi:hypothetical protein